MSYLDRLSRYSGDTPYEGDGDFYVSPSGDDQNDGSKGAPFQSIGAALSAAEKTIADTGSAAVCVHAGIYAEKLLIGAKLKGLSLRAFGDGEALVQGGTVLDGAKFVPLESGIYCCDLKELGLTEKEIGPFYPLGQFGTELKYDGGLRGDNLAVFFNGKRMELASYPREGWLRLNGFLDPGDCAEFPIHTYHPDWDSRRNHRGGEYVMDGETAARVNAWTKKKDVWVFGYWAYDWADASSPVTFNPAHDSFLPKYCSRFGVVENAPYRFINVFDELRYPGQYYLDRDERKLYLLPPSDMQNARIVLSMDEEALMKIDANSVTVDGLSFTNARSNAIDVQGDGNVLRQLKVYAVGGNAICIKGKRNLVSRCSLTDLGRGGVIVQGGDCRSLEPGENVCENSLIRDFGLLYPTYQPAVYLKGVGNICRHNEICYTPHIPIIYAGNEHLIEYNHIHHACLHTSDAGAIYGGRDWTAYGTVIRYNCIHDMGADGFRPDGIYFDDCLSGQTAYGNLLVNIPKNGFLIGGGRDNTVYNNLLAHCGDSIKYDDRARDAWVANGWYRYLVCDEKAVQWQRLYEAKEDMRAVKYPVLAQMTRFDGDIEDPLFPPNPTGSEIRNNVIIASQINDLLIADSVMRFSEIKDNYTYESEEEAGLIGDEYEFTSSATPANLENLPIEKMGRY